MRCTGVTLGLRDVFRCPAAAQWLMLRPARFFCLMSHVCSNCAGFVQVAQSAFLGVGAVDTWKAFCCESCKAVPISPSFLRRLQREHLNSASGDPTRQRGGRTSARAAGK